MWLAQAHRELLGQEAQLLADGIICAGAAGAIFIQRSFQVQSCVTVQTRLAIAVVRMQQPLEAAVCGGLPFGLMSVFVPLMTLSINHGLMCYGGPWKLGQMTTSDCNTSRTSLLSGNTIQTACAPSATGVTHRRSAPKSHQTPAPDTVKGRCVV